MGTLKNSISELLDGEIGDWYFYENEMCFQEIKTELFLNYSYPSSYEGEPPLMDTVRLPIHKNEDKDLRNPSWLWNGNMNTPTLSPSINVIGRWHGYFENGVLRTI